MCRKELARLHAEVTDRDEARQEEEEQLWAEHERHRQELEAEKIRLECLVERLHTQENEAQESLQKQRELLDQEAALCKFCLVFVLVTFCIFSLGIFIFNCETIFSKVFMKVNNESLTRQLLQVTGQCRFNQPMPSLKQMSCSIIQHTSKKCLFYSLSFSCEC